MRSVMQMIVLCLATVICAAEKKPITNADIVKMAKGGLGENTIVLAIKAGEPNFDLTPDGLVALSQANIPAAVIDAMLSASTPKAPLPPEAPVAQQTKGPSESDVRDSLESTAKSQSGGAITLASFSKINGQAGARDGVRIYSMDYRAVFQIHEDGIWAEVNHTRATTFRVVRMDKSATNFDAYTFRLMNPGMSIKRGEFYSLIGTISFEETENGWAISRRTHDKIEASERPTEKTTVATPAAAVLSAPSPNASLTKALVKYLETQSAITPGDKRANGKLSASCPRGWKPADISSPNYLSFEAPESRKDANVSIFASVLQPRDTTLEKIYLRRSASSQKLNNDYEVSDLVPAGVAGINASMYLWTATGPKNASRSVRRGVVMIALIKDQEVVVALSAPPDKFDAAFAHFRAVCESLNIQ